ncbi:alpha/beta hydrolase fold domain-containing protein [Azorhizobium doebereinerae]|uniref:alpha/beta hydrolase fold domain-containing protein n=1 Tax=Azorhizobium doebereinerae TaxID=281091 RepID=UPI00040FE2BA|nr:alpha/beta hydrolase [Azorhizobium doebereinerae]
MVSPQDKDLGAASPPDGLATPASAHPVLDALTQAFLDKLAEGPEGGAEPAGPAAARARFERLQAGHGGIACAATCHLLAAGPAGAVPVVIYRPAPAGPPLPFLFYVHGGGWVAGGGATHERLACDLALGAGIAVVLVECPHAPDHRHPAQVELAYAALAHVVAQAGALGLDGARFALGGDGTGGTTAAVLALLAKARRGPAGRLQLLFCPVTAPPSDRGSYADFAHGPWLTAATMRLLFLAQFPDGPPATVAALPCHATAAEMEDLPPALIVTAEADVLRDEAEAYGRRLMQAGVPVTLTRYLGAIHGFMVLNALAETVAARAAVGQACAALRSALEAA